MTGMIDYIKQKNEYTEKPRCCKRCRFFTEDNSTDNFGIGNQCIRNPDTPFNVTDLAVCNKWELMPNDPVQPPARKEVEK